MSTNEEKPKIIDTEGKMSIKVWSERLGKYYYKSKDTNYYNDYFHRTKHEMTCEICGRTVTCQMYSHKKSKRCLAVKQEKGIEKLRTKLEELTPQ